MLFKWRLTRLSLQEIGRIKQRLFQMDLKAWMLIQLRALKRDFCTKCTTTISTTLFLCLLVQEQQLCLQRCSSRLGMDLKLILYRTITKSGIRSLVIWSSFKRLYFDVLTISNVSFTPLYKGVKTCCLDTQDSYNNFISAKTLLKLFHIKSSLRISYQSSYVRNSRVLRVCIWFVLWTPLIVYQVFNLKQISF